MRHPPRLGFSRSGQTLEKPQALLLLTLLVFITVACGSQEGQLTGQIFIVTKGGENVRLGLVEVHAIPAGEITPFVVSKRARAKGEMEKLQPRLTEAKAAVEHAEAAVQRAVRIHQQLDQKKTAAGRPDEELQLPLMIESHTKRWDEPREAFHLASERASGAAKDVAATQQNSTSLQLAYTTLQTQYAFWTSPQYFFQGLPAGVASTKTDAEGNFSLTLDKQQRYAFAARGTRATLNGTEKYFWLFWVSLDGKKAKRILVSNDTLFEVPHADAVVRPEEGLP